MLKAKALEVRDALLESLVSKAREQNNDIISRYESILSRIAEKPTNEADLAALRVFIADSKEKVRQQHGHKLVECVALSHVLLSVTLGWDLSRDSVNTWKWRWCYCSWRFNRYGGAAKRAVRPIGIFASSGLTAVRPNLTRKYFSFSAIRPLGQKPSLGRVKRLSTQRVFFLQIGCLADIGGPESTRPPGNAE